MLLKKISLFCLIVFSVACTFSDVFVLSIAHLWQSCAPTLWMGGTLIQSSQAMQQFGRACVPMPAWQKDVHLPPCNTVTSFQGLGVQEDPCWIRPVDKLLWSVACRLWDAWRRTSSCAIYHMRPAAGLQRQSQHHHPTSSCYWTPELILGEALLHPWRDLVSPNLLPC